MTQIIKQSKVFIIIGTTLTLLQLLFDTLNVSHLSVETKTIIGAIVMLLSIVASGFKQFFDPKINDFTLWIQAILFFAYISGGLLDNFDMLPFNDEWKSIMRIILTFTANAVPILIKRINEIE